MKNNLNVLIITSLMILLFLNHLSYAASISGQVWVDANNNGIKEPSETVVPGESVELFQVPGNTFVASQFTNANGVYSFDGLNGSYYVRIPNQTMNMTQLDSGIDDTIDNDFGCDGNTFEILVEATFDATNIDAGFGSGDCAYCYNGAPFFSCPDAISFPNCSAVDIYDLSVTGSPFFYTNCNVEIEFEDIYSEDCPPSIERYFYIIDPDQNFYFCSQNIAFDTDIIGPTIDCPPDLVFEVDENCEIFPLIYGPAATDDCSPIVSISYEVRDIFGNLYDLGIGSSFLTEFTVGLYFITWTATDGCGNSNNCTQKVTVIDVLPPDLTVIDISTTNTSPTTTIYPDYFILDSYDNCGEVSLLIQCPSFGPGQTVLPPTAGTSCSLHCEEAGNFLVDIWVVDQHGNANYATANLLISDNVDDCCPEDYYFNFPVQDAIYSVWDSIGASNQILTNQNITYNAGSGIQFDPPFEVALGADFEAKIEGCGNVLFEQQKLTASDGQIGDNFGASVSIDGDYAIVGAPFDDDLNFNGSAYIFKRTGTSWEEEAKLVDPDGSSGGFGRSVSIDGDYAIVGSSERIHIFKRTGTSWTQQADETSQHSVGTLFGESVSISGDYAVAAEQEYDVDNDEIRNRHAHVFKRTGTTWPMEEELFTSDEPVNQSNYFETLQSVANNGDYVILGDIEQDINGLFTGSAFVFKRTGIATWTEEAILTPLDPATVSLFGADVAIDGERAIVGAVHLYGAYIFKRTGTAWAQEAKLIPSDLYATGNNYFNVSINGDYVIVNVKSTDSRFAYIFKRTGTSWNEEFKLTDTSSNSNIAYEEVDLSGGHAIVGAPTGECAFIFKYY